MTTTNIETVSISLMTKDIDTIATYIQDTLQKFPNAVQKAARFICMDGAMPIE